MQSEKTAIIDTKQQSERHQGHKSEISSTDSQEYISVDGHKNNFKRERLYTFKAIPSQAEGSLENKDYGVNEIEELIDPLDLDRRATPGFCRNSEFRSNPSDNQTQPGDVLTGLQRRAFQGEVVPNIPMIKIEPIDNDDIGTPNLPARKFSFRIPTENFTYKRSRRADPLQDLTADEKFLKIEKSVSGSDPESPGIFLNYNGKIPKQQPIVSQFLDTQKNRNENNVYHDSKEIREPTNVQLSTIEDVPSELSYTCFMKDLKAE